MNKLMSIADVVANLTDGMTIGIGGWGPRRKPMALIRAILNSDVKDLTIVAYGGADVGMLCAAGKVKKVIFAFVSLDFIPLEPFFRQARQSGSIEVMEVDEGMLLHGLRAASWGCPFIPTAVGLGTDVLTHNPDIQVINSPYDDKEWVAMPAIKLDVALVHVNSADQHGVCQINAPDCFMDEWFVRAADKAFVSTENLVDSDHFYQAEQANRVHWERNHTTGVVHIPGGAHPTSCQPEYGFDVEHFKAYSRAAKEGGFSGYAEQFINNQDEQAYQSAVGGLAYIQSLALPVY
ncbi:CoA-transferase [Thalassotalea ponticola]|uniref:CoA transferase subunit A n=1 Tax=Thalassotalea ponticola TaxID=1523392 RepID=UPI0025B31E0C|nr:CoA-transferase [Thalassotalea ponticola]MDN3653819.1 CoA-transferase [Thalassotalea ponticola]